jgi:hypothetical protein
MSKVGLPARVLYAIVALPTAAAAGFYSRIWLLPRLEKFFLGSYSATDDAADFASALLVAAVVGFTAFLLALTLPWKRRRRRSGRMARVIFSGVIVLLASVAFAGQGHTLIYDLMFAAWLSYAMAYTYVRYGVRDRSRRGARHDEFSAGSDEIE